MKLFDDVFSGKPQATFESRQLPDDLVNEALGEVNVRRDGAALEVSFTILMAPAADGWQTGVALDASRSMLGPFGKTFEPLPENVIEQLKREGLLAASPSDGRPAFMLTRQVQDRLREMNVVLRRKPNTIQPIARRFITYLAGEIDEDGGTTVVYWACGKQGDEYEVVGDFTVEQCRNLELIGPTKKPFGDGTRLTPVVRYFVERFPEARQGFYVFITDGVLDDMNDLINYTTQLARQIAAGRRNPVKCVLVGLGSHIDESQMIQLDDLDTGTDVDIWDHKIAQDMRGLLSLFAEPPDKSAIVAPGGTIYTSSGKKIEFKDGLRAETRFSMPAADEWFEIDLGAGGARIRQTVVFPNDR